MVQKHGPETVDVDAHAAESHRRHDAPRHDASPPEAPGHASHGRDAERHESQRHESHSNGREHGHRAPHPEGAGGAPVDQRIAELEAALEAAKAEAAQNWDKYLRERADMENYRRRLERNQADSIKQARKDLLLKTL